MLFFCSSWAKKKLKKAFKKRVKIPFYTGDPVKVSQEFSKYGILTTF